MKEIKYTISDEYLNRLVDAICGLYDYQPEVPNTETDGTGMKPNPESKEQFAKRIIKEHLIKQTKRWEEAVAKKAININEIKIT